MAIKEVFLSIHVRILIIIIIIIRHAPCQCVAPLATNSLHSDLSKAINFCFTLTLKNLNKFLHYVNDSH